MAASKKSKKKTPAKKTPVAQAKKAVQPEVAATGKSLEDFVKQATSDEAFLAGLESKPAATLKKYGYPASKELVAQLKQLDFGAFRRAFPPKKPGATVQWC